MSGSLLSISWFGSSGGGLPRRPELKSSGRFLLSPHVETAASAVRPERSSADSSPKPSRVVPESGVCILDLPRVAPSRPQTRRITTRCFATFPPPHASNRRWYDKRLAPDLGAAFIDRIHSYRPSPGHDSSLFPKDGSVCRTTRRTTRRYIWQAMESSKLPTRTSIRMF